LQFVKSIADKQDKLLETILTLSLGAHNNTLEVEPPNTYSVFSKKSALITAFVLAAIFLVFIITALFVLIFNLFEFIGIKLKNYNRNKEFRFKNKTNALRKLRSYPSFKSVRSSLPEIPTAAELEALTVAQNQEILALHNNNVIKLETIYEEV